MRPSCIPNDEVGVQDGQAGLPIDWDWLSKEVGMGQKKANWESYMSDLGTKVTNFSWTDDKFWVKHSQFEVDVFVLGVINCHSRVKNNYLGVKNCQFEFRNLLNFL